MKITNLLKQSSIKIGAAPGNKGEAIEQIVNLMVSGGNVKNREAYKAAVLAREDEGNTAVGEGIAIPHAKTAAVGAPGLAAMVIPDGVDYGAFDGQDVRLMFLIAAPEGGEDVHLEALAKLSTLLMDEGFRESLMQAKTPKEFLRVIDEKEAEGEKARETKDGFRVLGITACPTGIAHTYMAAEALEKAGEAMGVPVKIEIQGSGGAKNVLSADEIKNADGIIIAADKNVDLARFDGKPVLITGVQEGIRNPERLIREASGAPVHHHTGEVQASSEGGESFGRQIYKHLMNGVSHMLPFVIGGGLLIALAFLFDDYSIDPSNFGKNTPLAAYLKTIGELSFGLMLPVLAGYIAQSIADRPGLAPGFVAGLVAKEGMTFANPAGGDVNAGFLGALFAGFAAGYIVLGLKKATEKFPQSIDSIRPMIIYPIFGVLLAGAATTLINPAVGWINDGMTSFLNSLSGSSKVLLGMITAGMQSVDMGGPINKTSYVFATSQLAEGNFEIMAAVMAGGMVPPLAIALATTFFKNRFTEDERKSGLVNYLLGLSFISEGAIPFAAAEPLKVLPSCIIGSAVAGGLSMFFGCTLRAPHGGIFVLPTVGNPMMYALSILAGAAVGGLIFAVLRRPAKAQVAQGEMEEEREIEIA